MSTAEALAWVDGALVPRAQAAIPIDDFAVRYGAACFETMLARHDRVFRLDAHLDRLMQGLTAMRVQPPDRVQLRAAVDATLHAAALAEASVRLTVTAGSGHAPDLRNAQQPRVIVTVDAAPSAPAAARLRITTVRIDAHRPLAAVKTAQFLPYLLARLEAQEAGADDALLLNGAGLVAEAASANIFVAQDGRLLTPNIASGALPGITRAAVIGAATAAGIEARETAITLDTLAQADEVFLTSSVRGIQRVSQIDGAPPASAPCSWRARADVLTARVSRAYSRLLDREFAAEPSERS